MLRRLALPHASIHFRLLHNDRLVFDLPATTAEERWLSAWPDDFREQRLPVNLRDGEITLRGLIGLPELARPTQKYQFLYLNSRPIRDKFLQHALREAYRGLTEPGRHPAAIVMLDMPPQDVDVNVHPTKFEVRFKDSGRLHGMMLAGVREQLLGADLTPAAVARRDDATPEPQRQDMRSTLAEFFRQMPAQQPLLAGGADSTTAGAMPMPPAAQPPAAGIFPPAASRTPPEGFSPRAPEPSPFLPAPSAAIQLHNTYLVAQSDEGMIIIDQHALHERIMYEELWTRVQRGPLESQRMLIPQPIRVSSTQMALCEQIKPLLMRLGIEVEQFGPESLAVQAFPSFLEKLDPALFVRELLERGEQELLDLHDEELLHGIMDMMACKAAVKAGDPLTTPEIEALLARRELVERSSNCPHGRPTTLRLSLRDLEKQFKRTGF